VQAAIKSDIKRLIVFGRSGDELKEAVGKTGFSRVDRARTMSDAVKCAFKLAESGDTVILNPGCASFDEFNDFEHRGNEFKKQIFSLADR
jgi:UDP-N-acetylmuramoylalanine--D-glutamate ligase